jgi:hypothetical protein
MAEPGAPGDPMVDAAVPERVGGLGDAGERGQEGDGVDGNGNGDDAATLARLEALAKSPYDRALHRANVDAARTVDEREEARSFMSQMITLEGQDWTAWIDDRKAAAAQASDPPALEASIEILELYKRACAEFLRGWRSSGSSIHAKLKTPYCMPTFFIPCHRPSAAPFLRRLRRVSVVLRSRSNTTCTPRGRHVRRRWRCTFDGHRPGRIRCV